MLEPPKPNELTDTRRSPDAGHTTDSVGTLTKDQSMFEYPRPSSTYLGMVKVNIYVRVDSFKERVWRDYSFL